MTKIIIAKKMNQILKSLNKIKKPVLWLILFYLGFVSITLFIWLLLWLTSAIIKVPDLAIGLRFIDELTNMTFIGFICFIGGCFVDLNKNGIPDGIESKIDIKKPLDNLLSLKTHPDGE